MEEGRILKRLTQLLAGVLCLTLPELIEADIFNTASVSFRDNVGIFHTNASNTVIVSGVSAPASLPAPDLSSIPSIIDLRGRIDIQYPYPVNHFVWQFVPQGRGGQAIVTHAMAPGSASVTTASPRLDLTTYQLQSGSYLMTVQPYDINDFPGASASKSVTLVQSDLNAVKVYPNPWRGRRGESVVHFEQLPAESTVKIYTVAGRWVTSLPAPFGSAAWNLTNESGENVASGIYLYLITNGPNNQVRGTLTVIR